MCGIFGVILGENSGFSYASIKQTVDSLFKLSESRGKEASGIAFLSSDAIYVGKYPVPGSQMIVREEYKNIFRKILSEQPTSGTARVSYPISIIGHSRLVTNGSQHVYDNNQPVISSDMVGIHNGIITNVDDLWARFPSLERQHQVDTEILLSLIRKFYRGTKSLLSGVRSAFQIIEGVASIAVQFNDLNSVLLATNNGSIYLCSDKLENGYIFASEKHILQALTRRVKLRKLLGRFRIRHLEAGTGLLINLENLKVDEFSLDFQHSNEMLRVEPVSFRRKIIRMSMKKENNGSSIKVRGEGPYFLSSLFIDKFSMNKEAVMRLIRCTKCLLPETFPFIEFDREGVCNYCNNFKKTEILGLNALYKSVERYRRSNNEPECLVPFSGGRDSSYGVHFIKNVLKLKPVTYTYDWGMVTDLARRNQMRICGKLGIEHILVSADIGRKRQNIKKNVKAWLKIPCLGTVPLFMAGDKQYFYYANKIGKQTGCGAIILCENPLETTRFKSGFCGISPEHASRQTYNLALFDKIKLAWYYGRQCVTNPYYINSSVLDTLCAYCSYYFIPHKYLDIYRYIKWDEKEINSTLLDEYNWEMATDTTSTWRIGDGTASFYNYIYYTMAGFTENDTFRSNQIREGIINREEALSLVEHENEPRYESLMWYCDIIGIDFEETIKRINSAPKLYED